mmetsp:Transcript_4272/g.10853  ORF Transcript_4272/g.10853 Transcript_4272/m.10853 type:complete len:80 (+) Transcript_4272:3357-3596(+)
MISLCFLKTKNALNDSEQALVLVLAVSLVRRWPLNSCSLDFKLSESSWVRFGFDFPDGRGLQFVRLVEAMREHWQAEIS